MDSFRRTAAAACRAARLGIIGTIAIAAFAADVRAQQTGPEHDAALAASGWIETAWLTDYALALDAKLDTGAATSSLDASAYETFSRGGQPWVRFKLRGRDGPVQTIEAPVVRTARVRRAGAAVAERTVITLKLCVAGRTGEAEFTLADRSGMDFPILIGRQFMAGRLAVDPGRKFVGSGKCGNTPDR